MNAQSWDSTSLERFGKILKMVDVNAEYQR